MKIALFASLLGIEATGQSMAVADTANRLAEAGHSVTVIATDCGYQGSKVSKFIDMSPAVTRLVFPAVGKLNRRFYRSSALIAWMRAHINEFDLVDIHGIWSYSGLAIAKIARAHGKPYVLTPHGTMTNYDWQKSGLKRKLFFLMGFRSVWAHADAVRFLSRGEEKESYYPAAGRSVIIPNGISLDAPPTEDQRQASRQKLGIAPETVVLLFLGRITHQKGVKETLAAFELAAEQHLRLHLFLVGPAEAEYGAELLALVDRSPVRSRITVTGAVYGDAKYDYFRAADAFITLSHNEGLSIAHLEALSHGLPMLLTASSNLDHIEEYSAGAITTHDTQQAAAAILRVTQRAEDRIRSSRQARRLMEEKFDWTRVIPQLSALYQGLVADQKISGPTV